ncbi:transporter substrate-binding domain-containing protein [Legionella lytica]|uniref:Transporter substrate-binding domain-containing protein n=1 Tax=Legionella lytica TaxID=96232 RepID=A0ABY4Y7H8_9GAMM|nr:transporter substrate-binding domain-containing protein [Legionella lytica]USQ13593.1 transporter substrate-binding domain-containing protein [Legionella lytica]
MKLITFLVLLLGNIFAYGAQVEVGVIGFVPPFASEIGHTGQFYGFCIELMNEICKRTDNTCKYKATDVGKQLAALRAGQVDVAFLPAPVVLTPNEDYLYSLPYLPSQSQFMILNTNTSIHSIDDLRGKKIGVVKSNNVRNTVLSKFTAPDHVIEYDGINGLVSGITSGQVDALLLNASVSKYIINNVQNLKVIGKPFDIGMGYGIVALKKNALLINKINAALLQMEADGTYETIYKKYFGY